MSCFNAERIVLKNMSINTDLYSLFYLLVYGCVEVVVGGGGGDGGDGGGGGGGDGGDGGDGGGAVGV